MNGWMDEDGYEKWINGSWIWKMDREQTAKGRRVT